MTNTHNAVDQSGDFLAFLKHLYLGAPVEVAAREAGCPGYAGHSESRAIPRERMALSLVVDEARRLLSEEIARLEAELA